MDSIKEGETKRRHVSPKIEDGGRDKLVRATSCRAKINRDRYLIGLNFCKLPLYSKTPLQIPVFALKLQLFVAEFGHGSYSAHLLPFLTNSHNSCHKENKNENPTRPRSRD